MEKISKIWENLTKKLQLIQNVFNLILLVSIAQFIIASRLQKFAKCNLPIHSGK